MLLIYYLKGSIVEINESFLVLDVNSIGYKCFTDRKTLNSLSSKINEEILVFTDMVVREDFVGLFAFLDKKTLEFFKLLTSVSGVGSKLALSILSEFSIDQISFFIMSQDIKSLTRAPGLGKKLAQRIALELKDKVEIVKHTKEIGVVSLEPEGKALQALSALEMLGYSKKDVMPILLKLGSDLTVEEMIRESLKTIN